MRFPPAHGAALGVVHIDEPEHLAKPDFEPVIPDPPAPKPTKSTIKGVRMSERNEHKFEFSADQIAQAARNEADYHRLRLDHWQERQAAAKAKVESSIQAKLVEHEVTGGRRFQAVVDFGDQEAWEELGVSQQKIESHRMAAERHESDAEVYGSQGERPYMLDAEDVHHFRLSGRRREV